MVYTLNNYVSGNQYKTVNILFHYAMLGWWDPLNFMVFGVTFHESLWPNCTVHYNQILNQITTKLKPNPGPLQYTDSMSYTAVSIYTENTVTMWYISLNTCYTYVIIIYCCRHLYHVNIEYNNNLLYKIYKIKDL